MGALRGKKLNIFRVYFMKICNFLSIFLTLCVPGLRSSLLADIKYKIKQNGYDML